MFQITNNGFEHSKLYGWMGLDGYIYLPGAILRAPGGANNDQREK